jgi:hypothetical protein
MESTINYAQHDGIYKSELPKAIAMAALPPSVHPQYFAQYPPPNIGSHCPHLFLLEYVSAIRYLRSASAPSYLTMRITAFTLRTVLAGSETAGGDKSVVIAEGIIYSAGFFGSLYSAYTLALDWLIL